MFITEISKFKKRIIIFLLREVWMDVGCEILDILSPSIERIGEFLS
jgi:hypothetical protein